ncbi:hypothetical protein, variant 1 [Salpingoeca rosetta]|nr:hypothetical protein, variant 1 [Salpingoeca rosetta]XP_012493080.1 hypothetical protein, variant 2 [Salpingoeca rosetta]EGD72349.1 hypothetical protein, variant 2 [Salpingoeca rosetta]EGD72350.1 hypothetical protein, variant 1 [Salpingoeca rosetta]|eukprot:XP_004998919.1 hypothetical protein, variant 1 [Salpingoeca rosetta]
MLPRNQSSLMLSARTQRSLSGFGYMDVGLPPASPSDNEWLEEDQSVTVFLIAAYSKYSCPYVWVRTNHERLVKLTGDAPEEKDNPLKLRTTTTWASEDVKLWDIVTELIEVCAVPVPTNPFAVDFSFFECLPTGEAVVASGAMIHLLQRLLQSHTPRYHSSIVRDLQNLLKLHFEQLLVHHRTECRQLRPRMTTLEDLIPTEGSATNE